jgi:hypothetical protein
MKIKVSFEVKVSDYAGAENDLNSFEYYLKDLLDKSVLPALNVEMIPLTLNVTKKRG